MKSRIILCALIVICSPAYMILAQDKPLPEYGDISDLKGMTKVYVSTETTQVRKYVLDELKKDRALTVVPSVEQADFILECVQKGSIGNFRMGSVATEMPTFEMTAYTIRNGHHRIAWSKTKNSVRYPPTLLTGDFIAALKKDRK